MSRQRASRVDRAETHAARMFAAGLPTVLLVGRANAGKSTLFNRIAKGSRAITSAIPGTTRDLNFGRASYEGRDFAVIDSGGLELGGGEPMSERIVAEALGAVGAADVVVFIFDGRQGLGPSDKEALALIRETGCPLLTVVNKIDTPGQQGRVAEFYETGADDLIAISSTHGAGVDALIREIVARLPTGQVEPAKLPDLKLALIGRPNVGKSSLLNRLAGFERAIVASTPGTTRDPVDVRLSASGRDVLLIDTAGIRRATRVEGELERHSVGRAIESIRRADVVLLVIDATEGITDQDARLARLADTNDRAMVVICNKWDAAAKLDRRIPAFVRDAHERYPFLSYATMVFTSAATGDGVRDILPAAIKAGDSWRATFQTSMLNRILAQSLEGLDPPMVGRRRLNLMYVTQTASAPPRLRFFSNLERDIPAHYIRFLESRYRDALKLVGTPLRLELRKTGRTFVGPRGAITRPQTTRTRRRP
jgi:GTP-binding protein